MRKFIYLTKLNSLKSTFLVCCYKASNHISTKAKVLPGWNIPEAPTHDATKSAVSVFPSISTSNLIHHQIACTCMGPL